MKCEDDGVEYEMATSLKTYVLGLCKQLTLALTLVTWTDLSHAL